MTRTGDDAGGSTGEVRQLDLVTDYLAFVTKNRPLSVLLDEAPRKIAACLGAEVASLYLLEGDGRDLVLRGNVGFPHHARGHVRLALGEGITGRAVELKYPIASSQASTHESYRRFPDLDEERFPAFAAVPIIGSRGALGAVVVQRAGDPFSEAELSLLAALSAPIASAIRVARLLDDLRTNRRTGAGTRKVTLTGVPAVSGRVLGAISAVRRPSSSREHLSEEGDDDRLSSALESAARRIDNFVGKARDQDLPAEQIAYLQSFGVMLSDQRLRRLAFGALEQGESLVSALGAVVHDATRAAAESGEPFLLRRASDLEQLCDALSMICAPDPNAQLPAKAIVIAEQLSIYDLLVTTGAQPVGLVVTAHSGQGAASSLQTRSLLELLGIPAVSDVVGVFRWVSPGDIALLDADHGLLIVNPSRADIAAYRAQRRRERRQQS